MGEPLLDYVRDHWQGENDEFFVWLSDATFRKHFKAYMESQGLPALTYLELQEQFRQMAERHFQEFQRFRRLDYWLTCGDSDVRLQPRTREAFMRVQRGKDQ
jgi:hypothetical protein